MRTGMPYIQEKVERIRKNNLFRRNCLLKLEGRIGVAERRGKRRKRLLNDLKENGRYWKLKEDALVALCGELALEEVMDLP
jgi:hypothetical protein